MPERAIEEYVVTDEPFYLAVGREVELFEAAHAARLPVMLKGPTGCGKTRFVDHMAWRLGRPLVTVACHDDLSASDLTGRWLIRGGDTVWVDGPLTAAARAGAICYLDEVVEARPGFQLVVSYNPGYQHAIKDLKPSTRQRFVTLDFDYPAPDVEAAI